MSMPLAPSRTVRQWSVTGINCEAYERLPPNACDVMSRKTGAKARLRSSSRARHFWRRIPSEGSLSQLSSQCPTRCSRWKPAPVPTSSKRTIVTSEVDSPLAEDGRDSEWILTIRKSAVISFEKVAKEERNSARKASLPRLGSGAYWTSHTLSDDASLTVLSRPAFRELPKKPADITLPNAAVSWGDCSNREVHSLKIAPI